MGATKFGIPAQRFAGFENPAGDLGGRIVSPIVEGMGNFGQAVADYDYSAAPPDYGAPNIGIASGPALNAPLVAARPEDNTVKAKGAGAGASGAEATPEQQAMTPEDRLALAKYRKAHDMALNMGDLMALDDENVRLHPGGKNASSTTSSFSRAVAPRGEEWHQNQADLEEARQTRNKIRADQIQNVHDLSMAQGEHAMQSARMADAQASELTGMGARQERANADYKAQLDKTMADQEKANTAYQKASAEYDPDRLMRGGNQVIASLALAMGAFGSSLSHSPNYALEIINNAINRDMDRQKTGIASKKEQVTWFDHVMAGNRTRFSDENAARLMTRANAREVYATKLEGMAAKLGGVERMAAAKDQVAQLNMATAQDREHALRLEEARKIQEAGQRTTQTTTSQADTIVRPGDLIRNAKAAAETEKALREVSGGPKLTPSQEKQATDVNIQLGHLAETQKNITNYKDLVEQTNPVGRAVDWTQADHRLTSAQSKLARSMTKAQNTGPASDKDEAATEKQLFSGAYSNESLITKADEGMAGAGRAAATAIMALPPGRPRDEAVERLVGMVGQKVAWEWLNANVGAAGSVGYSEAGAAGGGR